MTISLYLQSEKYKPNRTIVTIEEYLEQPYWVIDILPKQVPANSGGQYFSIEEYYRAHPRIDTVYSKFTDILLKLNCYEDMTFSTDGDEWTTNPAPADIEAMVTQCLASKTMLYILLPSVDALITLSSDDTYMTVYHPNEETIGLLTALAASVGLFFWQP